MMGTLQENQSLNAEYERNKKEREIQEEIEILTAESTKWESKFYDEAKKVDKAIEYMERYMFSQKENYDYIHLSDILKGVDKE